MQAPIIHSFARRCWPELAAWVALLGILALVVLS